jgi:cell division protein FtsB
MPPSPINKHKSIIIISGVALCGVFLLVYFAPYGLRNYLEVREKIKIVNSELDELKQKNQELNDEISLLKTDANYVEKIARQKLGMLKKNELLFEIPEKKSNKE